MVVRDKDDVLALAGAFRAFESERGGDRSGGKG